MNKQTLAPLAALLMAVFLLGGCTLTELTDATVRRGQSTAQIGESITMDDWEIQVLSFDIEEQVSTTFGVSKPQKSEALYVIVHAAVTNHADSTRTFLPTVSSERTDVAAHLIQHRAPDVETEPRSIIAYAEDLHATHLDSGASKTGDIVFEVSSIFLESVEVPLSIQFSLGSTSYVIPLR
ncbi:MAG: DUF4352 domain-containing protein [Clostridiales bacterium]|nr:DUF4352 domain-containing protein [Clostridiales bacterium]